MKLSKEVYCDDQLEMFNHIIKTTGLKKKDMAEIYEVGDKTVSNWLSEKTSFPVKYLALTERIFSLMQRYSHISKWTIKERSFLIDDLYMENENDQIKKHLRERIRKLQEQIKKAEEELIRRSNAINR